MFRLLSLAAALLLPLHAFAATETVPLDVSLTVRESCRVEHAEGVSAPPAVSCALDSPYRVQANAAERPRVSRAANAIRHPAPAQWEVEF